MQIKDQFAQMAIYNQWMNAKVYDTAATLGDEAVARDRGAFFGSILGTLNHLAIADTLWMRRLSVLGIGAPDLLAPFHAVTLPDNLAGILHADLAELRALRDVYDQRIIAYVDACSEADFDRPLPYRRVNGQAETKLLGPVLLHVFNHQTHHRGQVTTLLTQAGVDVGVTDLLVLVPSL